jgi:hypothetical protein
MGVVMKILLSLLSMFLLVPGLTFAEAPVRTSDESMHGQLFWLFTNLCG